MHHTEEKKKKDNLIQHNVRPDYTLSTQTHCYYKDMDVLKIKEWKIIHYAHINHLLKRLHFPLLFPREL